MVRQLAREPVNGFVVSSYYGIQGTQQPVWKGTYYEGTPGMLYPIELEEDLAGVANRAEEVVAELLPRMILPGAVETRDENVKTAEWAFLSDEIYRRIGLDLYKKFRPQVFAVYFNAVDVVGHRFTRDVEWRRNRLLDRYGDVQRNYYLHMDQVVREYLELADENTLVIVLADHGLMRGSHTPNGVFVMTGPGIRKGLRIERKMRLTDVVPTLLYRLGLPVAEDMDGSVVLQTMEKEFIQPPPVRFIETYGPRENIRGGTGYLRVRQRSSWTG
jgi:arylsulfatase A-like enzyme